MRIDLIAPALFVSHGSPMFAVEPATLGPKLAALGAQLRGRLSAMAIVSAHWQSSHVRVMSTPAPQTIHDFGGFPPALYRIHYPASGAPDLAERALQLIEDAGFQAMLDERRGLDHGAWVPLRYLAPDGAIRVFQIAMPVDLTTRQAIDLGAALAALRTDGVMIVGSGGLTHNLQEYFQGATDRHYAVEFARWMHAALTARDSSRLINYRGDAPD